MTETRPPERTPIRTEPLTGWRLWFHAVNFPEGWVIVTFVLLGVVKLMTMIF